jgi:hypothetical protein
VLLSPDPLERGHRGAETVVVVVHVDGISAGRRADLSASSCLVVDLEIVEVRLRGRVGVDSKSVKDTLSVELRGAGTLVERDGRGVARTLGEFGRVGRSSEGERGSRQRRQDCGPESCLKLHVEELDDLCGEMLLESGMVNRELERSMTLATPVLYIQILSEQQTGLTEILRDRPK